MTLNGFTRIGPIRHLLERRYERWFRSLPPGAFPLRGVFASLEEARASIPRNQRVGYDHAEAVDVYVEEMSRMAPSDYPMVHWLEPLLTDGVRVFDFGGHVGTKYRAFARYLAYPRTLRWVVCDVPNTVAAGERLARERGDTRLEFTSDFALADGAAVLIASGVLQYVEDPLWERLRALREPPPHVLVNKLPCRDGGPVFTLQSTEVSFVPMQVFDYDHFVAEMCALGYARTDEWRVLDRACDIPFHPEIAARYIGLYFRSTQETAGTRAVVWGPT